MNETRITWTEAARDAESGSAGDILLFGMMPEKDEWVLWCTLPGRNLRNWFGGKAELRAEAEDILAAWLAEVSGSTS